MHRVQCLQHESFEGLAAIHDWLVDRHFDIQYTRFYESPILPKLEEIDWLIIMGGPMSVNDEHLYPWLKPEKKFILEAIQAGKVVIGICLGAQLIANTLGATVFPNGDQEIGWFPIIKNNEGLSPLLSDLPQEMHVFHWHGETFDLPKDAILHASSEACKNQIFSINDTVIGFQCHLEINASVLQGFVDGINDITPARYVQSVDQMLKLEKDYSDKMNQILFSVLSKLVK